MLHGVEFKVNNTAINHNIKTTDRWSQLHWSSCYNAMNTKTKTKVNKSVKKNSKKEPKLLFSGWKCDYATRCSTCYPTCYPTCLFMRAFVGCYSSSPHKMVFWTLHLGNDTKRLPGVLKFEKRSWPSISM